MGVGTLLTTESAFYLQVFNLSSAAFVITIALTGAGKTKAENPRDAKAENPAANKVSSHSKKIKWFLVSFGLLPLKVLCHCFSFTLCILCTARWSCVKLLCVLLESNWTMDICYMLRYFYVYMLKLRLYRYFQYMMNSKLVLINTMTLIQNVCETMKFYTRTS